MPSIWRGWPGWVLSFLPPGRLQAEGGQRERAPRSQRAKNEHPSRSPDPQTKELRQVGGVGALTSLAYILSLEDPARFRKRREVGPFLGMVHRQNQSGGADPQPRITKTGDAYLRLRLVGRAHLGFDPSVHRRPR